MFKKLAAQERERERERERAGASFLGGRGFRLSQDFGFRSAFRLVFVFATCFALSFLAGSLAFVPRQTIATLSLDIAAEPSLASSLNPSNLELTLNPTPLGTQVTGELTTTVTTDNPTGYKLTLQTKTSNTSLTHLNGIDTIPMTTNSTPNTLINNTWGFNPTSSATTFQSIPADGQTPYTLTQTTSPTTPTGETATITIGAKANTSIPAGLYTNVITFTATANPLPAPTITSVTPATGPTTGGTSITIAGTNFYSTPETPLTVTIGTATCTISTQSTTSITCTTSAATAGAKNVIVTAAGGTATRTNAFTYTIPALTEGDNLQDMTREMCVATTAGTTVNLKDTRDGKFYRVRKMADGNCWFIDNLAFQLNNAAAPAFNPAAALVSGTTSSVQTQAQYVQNNRSGYTSYGRIPNNNNPIQSYLYNWCAALGDTSTDCIASSTNVTDNGTVIGGVAQTGTATTQQAVTGICPAPFRLPKGGPQAASPTTPNTANEFVKLDIALGGTGVDRYPASSYINWTDTSNISSSWSGVLSGVRVSSGLLEQGLYGYWWSSTASSSTLAYALSLLSSSSNVNPVSASYKHAGFAVRCVL